MTQRLNQHQHKLVALALWLGLIGAYWWYTRANDLSNLDMAAHLMDVFTVSSLGAGLFVLIFIIQPVFLFPSAMMGVLGGCLFGPVWGMVYAVLGGNGAALLTYLLGRYFGHGLMASPRAEGLLHNYCEKLRQNSFETILVMHLIFLPYDMVNYMAGFLQVRWQPFVLATVLGSIPGTFTFVLFGASLEIEGAAFTSLPSLNVWTLVASLAMLAVSLLLSRYVRRGGVRPS